MLSGGLGVTLFFIISGFLITTLLLREEMRTGNVSLSAFYIRRAFRIFPLYYVALAFYVVAVLGLGIGRTTESFGHRLVFLLTYTNEFSGSGAFSQSWSLGIEEKFYLVWPFLAFSFGLTARRRGLLVVALLAIVTGSWIISPSSYLPIYLPIMLGCALGLALNDPRAFALLSRLTAAAPAVLVAAVAAMLFVENAALHTRPLCVCGRSGVPCSAFAG